MLDVVCEQPEVSKYLATMALVDCTTPFDQMQLNDVMYLAKQAHAMNEALATALRDYVSASE